VPWLLGRRVPIGAGGGLYNTVYNIALVVAKGGRALKAPPRGISGQPPRHIAPRRCSRLQPPRAWPGWPLQHPCIRRPCRWIGPYAGWGALKPKPACLRARTSGVCTPRPPVSNRGIAHLPRIWAYGSSQQGRKLPSELPMEPWSASPNNDAPNSEQPTGGLSKPVGPQRAAGRTSVRSTYVATCQPQQQQLSGGQSSGHGHPSARPCPALLGPALRS
jgi:hypothetical protein